VLVADTLEVTYGAVRAVRGVSISVAPGEVVALLGPNGAGKTSTLRGISRLVAGGGVVTVDGQRITTPHEARAAGIIHVPQGRGLFRRLTVEQNLALGAYGDRRSEREGAVDAALMRLPELNAWRRRRLGSLSGGEQILVALARLLAGRPRYALLDELTLGLSPVAGERFDAELEKLAADGVGIVLVDQYAGHALRLAERAVVLERGRVVATGTPASLDGGLALTDSGGRR
jgi:branched-chain amino acid transport system ATP-binding protein